MHLGSTWHLKYMAVVSGLGYAMHMHAAAGSPRLM